MTRMPIVDAVGRRLFEGARVRLRRLAATRSEGEGRRLPVLMVFDYDDTRPPQAEVRTLTGGIAIHDAVRVGDCWKFDTLLLDVAEAP